VAEVRSCVEVQSVAGQTPWRLVDQGRQIPLLHLNPYGKGQVAYLASASSTELTAAVIDRLSGSPPITLTPAGSQAIVTHQPGKHRWIVHLMDDGDYAVELHRDHATAQRVVDRYPKSGWEYEVQPSPHGLHIRVRGNAQDRLLVLE
jgi:hypothetical protein